MSILQHAARGATGSGRGRLAVVIPVWQPEPVLVSLVDRLLDHGFGAIVIVDDGSDPGCEMVLAQFDGDSRVHRLRHFVNLGKGRALKTAINYCLCELTQMDGVVTADGDGQHTVEAIVTVAEALLTSGERPVLGSRGLTADDPLRSRIGNAVTRRVFAQLTGATLRDTQSGLRGFPCALLCELMLIAGERYEYEMAVLAELCRTGRRPIEVPIRSVYFDGNRSSHFHPVRDSARIYAVLARLLAAR